MSKNHVHLTETERELKASKHWEGKGPSEIARALERDKGTISRELARNTSPGCRCYTPCRAQTRSDKRKLIARHSRHLLKSKKILQYVRRKLKINCSPEIIAGRLKDEMPAQSISPEAIYQFIYHRDTPDREQLISQLCRAHRKRRIKGKGRKVRKTKIPNSVSIDARPKSVDKRKQFGHWENPAPILNDLRKFVPERFLRSVLSFWTRHGTEDFLGRGQRQGSLRHNVLPADLEPDG